MDREEMKQKLLARRERDGQTVDVGFATQSIALGDYDVHVTFNGHVFKPIKFYVDDISFSVRVV